MRKYIGCGLALVWCMVVAATLFFMCGCGLTEVKYDNQGVMTTTPVPGATPHTQLGDTLTMVSSIGKSASAVMPGGLGLPIGCIAGLVGLAGTAATSIAVAHKRGGTLEAVIRGVEAADNDEVKESIRRVAGDLGYEPYLHSVVEKITEETKPVMHS